MEMNQITGQGLVDSPRKERTVLSSHKMVLKAGLMDSAVNHTEEYVRPDPPDNHRGHGKQCMALDYLENVYIFSFRGP